MLLTYRRSVMSRLQVYSLPPLLQVHFNLFGGTVLKLGTKAHHDAMLAGIDRLDPTGCFALTELGFGENAC
jgi:acyl-CoA oxidase